MYVVIRLFFIENCRIIIHAYKINQLLKCIYFSSIYLIQYFIKYILDKKSYAPYQTMSLSFNSNTMGVTSGTGTVTVPEHLSSSPVCFSGVFVTQSLVFCVVFCQPLFVYLSIFLSSLAEQELLTLPEHLTSYPVFWQNSCG